MSADLVIAGILQTLWMVVPAALLAQALGLALGVVLVVWHPAGIGPRPAAYRGLGAIVNVGRSLPFVILLVLVIPLSRWITGTSIGASAAIVPLTIAAIPFVARLVEAALLEVPRGTVDAARALGATRGQILGRVLLPEAVPALVRGFTVALVNLVGASAMAGAIGGGGLGDLAIRYGYQRFEAGILAATVIALVGLVQLAQSGGERVARQLDHRLPAVSPRRLWIAAGLVVAAVAGLVVAARVLAPSIEGGRTARVLRVGASATPQAEILEVARPLLARQGIALEIRVFDDYVHPNLALGDGSIDANFFQHVPYLDEFQRNRPLGIVPRVRVFVAPMAIYSAKVKALADLPAGATIAIPNDPSNSGRALHLFARAGLLRLDPGAPVRATARDIRDNPRGLVFRELDAAQLPRVLPDVDAAVLNTNYALQAGLSPGKDGLFVESADSPYANVLAILPALAGSRELAALEAALTSPEVRAFIVQRYGGNIVPVF
jgi:YaeC family lipoprotein